jgi:hypothetical protein
MAMEDPVHTIHDWFNSFKSYKNEILKKSIWKIMQELIKIKHVNF